MSLLPLGAWAKSISTANVAVGDYTYGNNAALGIMVVWEGETLTKGTHYTLDTHFYADEACTVDKGTDKTKLEVGTYWVKVTGIGTGGFDGEAKGSFHVTKAPLTVTVTMDPAAPTKVYDGTTANPAGVTIASWTGAGYKNGDTDLGGGKPVNVTGTLTWSYKNANVGDQAITFTGLTFKNYEPTYAAKTIKITPKPLTTAMVTAANFTETYKGKAFDLDKDITVTVKDGTKVLVAGKDFTVKAYSNEALTAPVTPLKNAGDYYVGVTSTGTTNYSSASPIKVGTLKINKSNMTVLVNDQSFVYDGASTIAGKIDKTYGADKGFQFVGLVGEDTEAVIGGARTIGVADDTKKAAGEYAITATEATFTQTNANYNLFFQPGTFTIEQRDLTIAADNKSMSLGAALPELTATITGYVGGENADMIATGDGKGKVKVTRKAGDDDALGEHKEVLEVSYNASADVFKNYKVTTKKGNLTINGGAVLITVKPQTIVYGDDETWSTPQEGRDYFVNGVAEADKAKLNVTITRATPDKKDPGTYALTVTATKPEGYSEINYVNSTLTIGKRELQVTALPQTLAVGQAVDGLDLNKIEFAAGHGLAFEDKAEDILKLKFSATVEGGLTDGKLVSGQVGDYNTGIEVALKNVADPHYTIKMTAGKLTVSNALVLNRPAKAAFEADATVDDAAAVIASAHGKTVAVRFGDFAMKAEKWYPIVLPFATTVREVSTAFGYAVVNILNEKNTDETKIAFKLHMGAIPANTPFVVKIDEAKNMNTVTFNSKTIVNSAAPEVADGSGVKFIGSYSHKVGFKANEYFFSVSDKKNDYYSGSATNATYMAPLSAYFQTPEASSARIIEFEEPDGTVTAIKAVTTVNDSKINEGIYNLNGVKLNSVPTQKGVYIVNGKKVVIK